MTSQELALREATQSAIQQFRDPEFATQVAAALPEGVSPRQLLRAASTAVLEKPELADPQLRHSLLQATLKTAQDGLLPDGREAAFVVYGQGANAKVQYQPMVGGIRKIAAEHGWALTAAVVYENDVFEPDYDEHRANHRPPRLGADRGEPIGAYAIAEHRDGRRLGPLVMDKAQIERVRQVSRAKNNGPWVTWWDRMAEKTPAKRLFKELPLDPGDKRVGRVLSALENEHPDIVLYGSDQDRPARATPLARQQAESAGEKGSTSPNPPAGESPTNGAAPNIEEPSDEELDAMAAAETVEGEVVEETEEEDQPVFITAKGESRFEGKTIAEVWESGPRGRQYLKWAVAEWTGEPMRSALLAFAQEHPEVTA